METSSIALAADYLLETIAIILIAGMIFGKISDYIKIPDVVLYILAGIILGPHALGWISVEKYEITNQLILTFGAAYILYDGGREIKLKILNKVKVSVMLLATLGVLISTFITGYFASRIFNIDIMTALLLGSVIASTDPSVLVPLFKKVKINNKLKQTIISESAFNDAAGAIITFAIIGIISGKSFSAIGSTLELLKTAGGGILVGLVIGYISSLLVAHKEYAILKEYPAELSVATVIISYILSNKLGFSGFMSVFIVGMICGNKKVFKFYMQDEYFTTQHRFREVLTIILRMMIFILLGTHVELVALAKYWKGALAVVLILMFVARPISVLISVSLDRKAKWSLREIIYLMWVRETGVIPAALSGMIVTLGIPNAQIISSVTFATILITLTVQASTSAALARYLKLDEDYK
ncbi:putative Na(+)/H(+) antiporter [Gottschalkia acidurici 9a]|uniref:Na(+)/H(+) antiporter n=1 Tax=Gottschalkia acidurici (strain ATCC 7906 / DSM 604 / BCRC 14475 / CIP 104303 / KCTC 5404 / NCIMB 10678 / 9a) TaxID=1128398 RepID=K0AY68_GOTA9|nr:sodium:proton antiporter [Gottschalkia acidurici]AFS77712.1 putative Na(+)/H(+) antiporter [Gottschalkia acidurici 9a]